MKSFRTAFLGAIVAVMAFVAMTGQVFAVQSATVSSITPTLDSAAFQGSVSGVSDTKIVRFYYGKDSTSLQQVAMNFSGMNFSVNVTGLSTATKYYYRIVHGTGGAVSILTDGYVTTLGTTVRGSISSLSVSSTTISLRGTISNSLDASKLKIAYGTSSTSLSQTAPVSMGGTYVFTAQLSGLSPAKTYYYALIYVDSGATQYISSTANTTTAKASSTSGGSSGSSTGGSTGGSSTGGSTGGASTTGSATISFIDPQKTAVGLKGSVSGVSDTGLVHLFYGIATDRITSEATLKFTGNNFSANITGLAEGTTYYYVIAEQSGGKTATLAKMSTFSTLGAPILLRIQSSDTDAESLVVKGSITGINYFADVHFVYGAAPDRITLEAPMEFDALGNFSVRVSDLSPATTYYYLITYLDSSAKITPLMETTPATTTRADSSGSGGGSSGGTVKGPPLPFDGGLVPCEGVDENGNESCDFIQFMNLISRIIDFLLTILAPVIATIVMLMAGIQILTSGGSPEKVAHAKGMFMNVVFGLVIALGAWVIVKSIMVGLGYDSSYFPHFWS